MTAKKVYVKSQKPSQKNNLPALWNYATLMFFLKSIHSLIITHFINWKRSVFCYIRFPCQILFAIIAQQIECL